MGHIFRLFRALPLEGCLCFRLFRALPQPALPQHALPPRPPHLPLIVSRSQNAIAAKEAAGSEAAAREAASSEAAAAVRARLWHPSPLRQAPRAHRGI